MNRIALVLTFVLLAVVTAPAAAAPVALPLDAPRFWYGGQIDDADVPSTDLCGVAGPCPQFPLSVAAGGARLRVAIDTPSREDGFQLQLIDPAGAVAGSASASNQFNAEAFVADPAPGEWMVRVVPKGATDAFFRLRARLEPAPPPADERRALLPNLKAVPPYEFGFAAPANPLNGAYPPDTVNPPLSAAGQEPLSCAPDELAPEAAGGAAAKDCLRLTTGPINTGDGPFVKLFTFAGDVASGETAPPLLRGPARQQIWWSDGTTTERPAGTYSYHTTHAHFHDDGILTYELFRVGEAGALSPAGRGTKSGFCPADQLIGEWRRFAQDPAGYFGEGDNPTGNCLSPTDGVLALTRGWGDVYRWQRPGQYVEFAGNGDGLYVARATVDKSDTVLETDEGDNSSYALIRVAGRRIELVERGQGASHLDPRKTVFTGLGPASQDPYGGDLPELAAVGAPGQPPAPGVSAATAPSSEPPLGGDRDAPVVRILRVRGRRLTFSVSEPALVRVTVLRRGATWRAVRSVRAAEGRRTVHLPARGRGRYRVGVVARDAAGNASAAVSRRVRLR